MEGGGGAGSGRERKKEKERVCSQCLHIEDTANTRTHVNVDVDVHTQFKHRILEDIIQVPSEAYPHSESIRVPDVLHGSPGYGWEYLGQLWVGDVDQSFPHKHIDGRAIRQSEHTSIN